MDAGFRYAVSLTNRPHDAEDLVQHACLKVLRRRGNLTGKAYLFKTIRHLYFDSLRRHTPTSASTDLAHLADADLGHVVSDHAPGIQDRLDMERLLEKIRPAEREVLYLSIVEGYTAQEIARLISQPRGTILSLLSRGRRRLQELHQRDEVAEQP